MSRSILLLKNVTRGDIAKCGGKGANLGELLNLGMNVPDGFIITSETISEETSISKELEAQIYKSFDNLNSDYVAVRSSATSEDSLKNAWAGQFATFLYTKKNNLIENIRKCLDSMNQPRVIAYRKEQKLENIDLSVAVVVQKMVDAEVSGVVFTVDPISRNLNTLIIEAIYGLGEAIVSGMVTPDHYVFNKADCSVKNIEIEKQTKQIVKSPSGTKAITVSGSIQSEQKLSTEKIKELCEMCVKIEKHYSYPQDIEWCFKDNVFYILQSRPITTL